MSQEETPTWKIAFGAQEEHLYVSISLAEHMDQGSCRDECHQAEKIEECTILGTTQKDVFSKKPHSA
jgi:hypothetical protein